MIETPRNVCFDDGRVLHWSRVPYASGYNIHSGDEYKETVIGGENTSIELGKDADGPYSVSAWVVDQDGKSSHTPRSEYACSLFEPAGELVVDERFENLDNWITRYPYWDHVINNELQNYTADSVSSGDDGLVLTAKKTGPRKWNSGIVTGDIKQSSQYGYFEVDIEFTIADGLLPAFWLLNKKYTGKKPEIDIMEMVGGRVYQSYHSWHPERNSRTNSLEASNGFNLYGLLWEPHRLTWYYNRRPVFEIFGDNVSDQDMYPILNLAVGGSWPGDPDDYLESAKMCVKSYRVWR